MVASRHDDTRKKEALCSVAAFGAVHWDVIAHADRPIRRETSTPAVLAQKPGGVATNVARSLARLDVRTRLTGVIGDDPAGQTVRGLLQDEGVTTDLLLRQGFTTGQYLALHDPDGSLAAACIDDTVLTTAEPSFFAQAAEKADRAALWFVDANLPEPVLTALAAKAPSGRLVADAVSVAKTPRLAPILPKVSLLLLNRAEAATLAGASEATSLSDIAAALLDRGAGAVIITDGANPVHLRTQDIARDLPPPPPAAVVDVTGAGDALIAGTLAALARDAGLEASVRAGLNAARLTLESPGAVAEGLTWSKISP